MLAGKRKRGEELVHQHVRHSLWEQGSPGGYNELLFACFDGEVAALQQRDAEYVEARRQSDGSDTCGSCSDNDSNLQCGRASGGKKTASPAACAGGKGAEGGERTAPLGASSKEDEERDYGIVQPRQAAKEGSGQEARRDWKEGTETWQVEHTRVQR